MQVNYPWMNADGLKEAETYFKEVDRLGKKIIGGTIDTIWKTTAKIIDNSRITAETGINVVGDAIQSASKNAFQTVQYNINQTSGVMSQNLITPMEEAFSQFPGQISSVFSSLKENSSEISKIFDGTTDMLNGISSQFKNLSSNKDGGIGGVIESLMRLTSKGGIIADVVGAISTVGGAISSAIDQWHEAAVQANLEEHFGDITLSIEDIEDAAKALTENEWTIKIDAILAAKEKIQYLEQDVQASLEEINRTNWKVRIGIELGEDEKEQYKQSLNNYVSGILSYMEGNHYAATLTIDTFARPGSEDKKNLTEYVNEYYNSAYSELQRWGTIMAEEVNTALEDGILTEAEIDTIQNALNNLQEYARKEKEYEEKANFFVVSRKVDKKGVSLESIENFVAESIAYADESWAEQEEVLKEQVKNALKAKDSGLSNREFDNIIKQAYIDSYTKGSEAYVDIHNTSVDSIANAYAMELNQYKTKLAEKFDYAFQQDATKDNPRDFFFRYEDALESTIGSMNWKVSEAVGTALQSLQAPQGKLEEIASYYRELGYVPAQNIVSSLQDSYMLELLSGDATHLYDVVAGSIANSPAKREIIAQLVTDGAIFPTALADSLRNNYGLALIKESGQYIWRTVGNVAAMNAEDIKKQFSEIGITLPNSLAASLADEDGAVVREMFLLFDQIKSGIEVSAPFMRDTLKIMGIDVTDGLIESILEQEPNVQMGVINMLYGMKGAVDTEKFDILNSMYTYGIEVPNSMMKGMKENYAVLEEGAKGAAYIIDMTTGTAIEEISPSFGKYLTDMGLSGFSSMNSALKNKKLNAPKMKDIDADAYINKTQKSFLGKSVQVTADLKPGSWWSKLFGSLNARATGGIVESPEIALIGEAGPESIIPLSSSKRTRALELYTQTSEALGVDEQITRAAVMSSVSGSRAAMAFLAAGPVPSENRVEINYKKLAQELYGALSASPIQVKPSFTVTGGDIYLDTTKAGKALAPHIDAELGRINHRRERGI